MLLLVPKVSVPGSVVEKLFKNVKGPVDQLLIQFLEFGEPLDISLRVGSTTRHGLLRST